MKNRTKMIIILTVFGLISGAVLSLVYMISKPYIEKNMMAEQKRAIFSVVPNAKSYEEKEKNGMKYFECKDASGNVVGIA
ncbi:MAG: electron transporter RnfG, partial [Spirochaetes bacterium]